MISYAHMGNGITCWRTGTNTVIAHISVYREITYSKEQTLSEEDKEEVIRISKIPHISVSYTQRENVYLN